VFEWLAHYILQVRCSNGQHFIFRSSTVRVVSTFYVYSACPAFRSLAHRTFAGYRHHSRFSYSKRASPSWVLLCTSFPWLTDVSSPSWTVFLTLTLRCACRSLIIYDIYLLNAIGLSPGGSITVHIYTQTIHRTTQITTERHKQQLVWKSAGRAPSLRVLPRHLPYN